ncbi:MAG TPA: tetratricopeptide repeat protein, partial [Terriglobales bacterium]|nr:tetratricopeptide repeat protein [Terriglobales bacterium]
MSEITQQVEADMPSTEVHIQAQQNNPPTVARRSSTVSVAELMVPEKAKSLFNKATNLMQQSKFDKAQENLKKALTIAPQYARALALEAVICAQNKDLSSAMKNADNAVASDAQLPFAQFVRAMVLNATGRFQEASVAA